MAADRIKLAEPAPSHCSSCFSAKPKMRHVDFGAFYDGPVIGEGVVQHVIDDLIVCEQCLTIAARLLGLGDVGAVEAELHRAEEENDRLLAEKGQLREYSENLKAALLNRPEENGKRKVAA